MPLIMNGPPHCSRSQARSSQVGGADPIHWPYAPKKVGTWASRAPRLGTRRSGRAPLRIQRTRYSGLVATWGAYRSIALKSSFSGSQGLPQSRRESNTQSSVMIRPLAPAARARSARARMSSRLPTQ